MSNNTWWWSGYDVRDGVCIHAAQVKEKEQQRKEREQRKAAAQARLAEALKQQEEAILAAVVANDANQGEEVPQHTTAEELEARAMQEERRRVAAQVCALLCSCPPSRSSGRCLTDV